MALVPFLPFRAPELTSGPLIVDRPKTSSKSYVPWNGALYWASVTGSVEAAARVMPLSDPFIFYLCKRAAVGRGHKSIIRLLEGPVCGTNVL